MCVDPQGPADRLRPVRRAVPRHAAAARHRQAETKVEKIPVAIGEAQGLLWAFDSLYVVGQHAAASTPAACTASATPTATTSSTRSSCSGRSTARGEHGPHAVLLSPDGKSLYVVCGNDTKLTQFDRLARAAALGRGPPAAAHARRPRLHAGRARPRRLHLPRRSRRQGLGAASASAIRNQYDAAFNRHGDLFTYDADMEWDFNTPWYRPTRVCHAASGREFGWRNGAGKWPAVLPRQPAAGRQHRPRLADRRRASATGRSSRRSTRTRSSSATGATASCTPSTWRPTGAAYSGKLEEFVTGTPLPLTDLVINPHDGAMYFAIGGRKTQSGLYRVTYAGSESTAPSQDRAPQHRAARAAAPAGERSTAGKDAAGGRGRLAAPRRTPTAPSATPPASRSSTRTRPPGATRPWPRRTRRRRSTALLALVRATRR